MATDRQIEANRRNAQHCTGPKSDRGKARSSQNALKTGLHAKSDVIATESQQDYESLIAEYYACHQPATPEERSLVDDLIRSEWLGRRYMAATAGIWNRDFLSMKEQDMGRAFMRNSEALSRAQRCITATQRNYALTLKQLHALQAKHPAGPVSEEENAENAAEETEPLRNTKPIACPADLAAPELSSEGDPPDIETPPIAA
jgi:hypothetical protein